MTEKIIELSYKLNDAINHDERIIHLNEVEKRMNECEEVMSLSYKKDMALDRYNEMLKCFKEDSEEVNNARKLLAEAKKNLESHELVREYLKAYQEVRLLFEHINDSLFSILNMEACPR